MKAARLHAAGDLRVEHIPAPGEPKPGNVRLRVTAAGICGSDLHNFRTGQWISRAPSVAGHEFAGVITALGPGVAGLAPGDTVVADSRFWCGDCPACRSGRRNVCARLGFVGEVCDGGFAEEVELPARLVLPHDPDLNPAIAAMAEPLAVALHAVRRLDPRNGEPVLVAGCGPIGGLAAVLLSRLHDGALLVADRNGERAANVAEATGAAIVDLDAGSIGETLSGRPLRHAIDATGSIPVVATLLDLIAGGGSLALVGIAHGRLDLDPNLLVEREIALLGCHVFQDELPEAVAMLGPLAPMLRPLIDREIGIDDIPAAYQRLIAGESRGLKTIVRMGGAGMTMDDRPRRSANGLPEAASPLYEQVKDYVLKNIGSGEWSKDQRLPSENELVTALGVSRMTVNRALRELTSEGYLLRIQGVGTFVAPPKPQSALIEIIDIADEIRARGSSYSAKVVLLEKIDAPSAELVGAFEFGERRPISHSIVVHCENDIPVLLEERFVNADLVPDYHKQDFEQATTTYDYLTRAMPLTEVEHVISAVAADDATAGHLMIAAGEPCLLLHRRTWSGAAVATVNKFIYAGSRYSLGSRYAPGMLG